MIKHISGEVEINDYIAPASTAFAFNDVVTRNSSGQLAKATNATPRSEILGLIQQTIASTDTDYASTKVVAVLEPCNGAEFECDVGTGTLATTMVGKRFSLKDENEIDVNNELQKCVEITNFLTTTKARVKFVKAGDKMRLVSYQQTVSSYTSFTDGGGAAGTFDLTTTIPAGAVFERALVTDLTGFAGDVSATLQIGDGSTADRYSTGTPSVFATAAAGCNVGAPSGTLWHTAAVTTVRLTITVNADWGSVTAGALTVTLFWYEAD